MIIWCFAYFEKEGKILLQKRAGNNTLSGQWWLVGWGKEVDESLETCLIREVYEESNITIHTAEMVHAHETKNASGNEILLLIWRVSDWTGEAQIVEPEEASAYEWFDRDALPDTLTKNLQICFAAMEKNIFYSQS